MSVYAYVYGKTKWQVSEYGEIRDTFKNTQYVFEVPEITFFETYNDLNCGGGVGWIGVFL